MKSDKYNEKIFDRCVNFLLKLNYIVTLEWIDNNHRFALVTGNGIMAGFHEKSNNYKNSHINGKICADNEKCFDKWSKCPVELRLPVIKSEYEYLEFILKWLNTEEGYKVSNEYDFDKWITDYPD